jgi:hypothetical protein
MEHNHTNLSQEIRFSDRDLNPGHPEMEAGGYQLDHRDVWLHL